MSAGERRAVPALAPGTRGLRRHAALIALSREHHAVLVRALDLKRAAEHGEGPRATAAARAFLELWSAEMQAHFADEEQELLPLAAAFEGTGFRRRAEPVAGPMGAPSQTDAPPPPSPPTGFRRRAEPVAGPMGAPSQTDAPPPPSPPTGVLRIESEHREIAGLAAALAAALASEAALAPLCAELGQLLDDHVRYEERAFFESLQRHLAPEELNALGLRLERRRATRGAPSCAVPTRPVR